MDTAHSKLEAVTETRRALSNLLAEQATGLRSDINEQAERLLTALYEAGAARAGALLEKYAPQPHGLSHARKCPACGGWWPRHMEACEIAEVNHSQDDGELGAALWEIAELRDALEMKRDHGMDGMSLEHQCQALDRAHRAVSGVFNAMRRT